MERLTERFDGWVMRKGCHGPCRTCDGAGCDDIYPMIDRLAAYEDTGLEPGEIAAVQEDLGVIPFGRFQDIMEAERDGRLVVLPCKPDDTFFQWKKSDNIPSASRFEGVAISEDGEITYPMTRWGEVFTLDDFGKTVFLTREEAEAAIKKKEKADNEAG